MGINKNSLAKRILIPIVIILGCLYALPNVFGEYYAVQITSINGKVIDQTIINKIKTSLDSNKLNYLSISQQKHDVLIKINNAAMQLKIQDTLKQTLDANYVVALNLASASPKWLTAIGAEAMKLGLDLRGGVHFLMQVDIDSVLARRLQSYTNDIRDKLRSQNLRYRSLKLIGSQAIRVTFATADIANQAQSYLQSHFPEFVINKQSYNGTITDNVLDAKFTGSQINSLRDYAMEQSLTTLRNRVNELGVAEALVQRQGLDRIVVELPGIQDTARAKDIIGKTATVEFHLTNPEHGYPFDKNTVDLQDVPPGYTIYDMKNIPNKQVMLNDQALLSGDSIDGASATIDQQTGTPAVQIRLGGNPSIIDHFTEVTTSNIGKPLAVLYVETKFTTEYTNGKPQRVKHISKKVINVATINQPLSTSFIITGLSSMQSAKNLAILLRSGALPAPIDIVAERTVGPSLGQDNIKMGVNSVIGGLVLVLVFMAIYYSAFGLIADISLLANLVILIAICSLIHVTMTLPGIAGIVLTLGMAVDANVLIFERIREELRNSMAIQSSIATGYDKALTTIVDANVSTLIAAMVLFTIGSGAVKGFAVTLTIGLLTSMFTSVVCSRVLVNQFFGNRKLTKLPIGV